MSTPSRALSSHSIVPRRTSPNVIITGTPGVGKSTHCTSLIEQLPSLLQYIDINSIAKSHDCITGHDEALDTAIVDEDKLLDVVEPLLKSSHFSTLDEDNDQSERDGKEGGGGNIIDWHSCDIFPDHLIDLVVVIRCSTEVLYDRLVKRGYNQHKRDENMDAEIMEVVLSEARDAYDEEKIVVLQGDTLDDLEGNVERLQQWIETWRKDHPDGVEEMEAGEETNDDDDD